MQVASDLSAPVVLPVEHDGEAALLGAILRDNGTWARLSSLGRDCFDLKPHRLIFDAIGKLISSGTTANALTLRSHFEASGVLTEVGGSGYIVRLAASSLDLAQIDEWAEILRDRALRRRGITQCEDFKRQLSRVDLEGHAYEIVGDAASAFSSLCSEMESKRRNIRDVRIEIAESLRKPLVVHSTGFKRLDQAMGGGLQPSRSYCFAGRNKSGKTTFASTISAYLNHGGVKHFVVACEMGARQIEHRCMARELGRNALAFTDRATCAEKTFKRRSLILLCGLPAT
jgi:replicative DNA helicase